MGPQNLQFKFPEGWRYYLSKDHTLETTDLKVSNGMIKPKAIEGCWFRGHKIQFSNYLISSHGLLYAVPLPESLSPSHSIFLPEVP